MELAIRQSICKDASILRGVMVTAENTERGNPFSFVIPGQAPTRYEFAVFPSQDVVASPYAFTQIMTS